MNNSTFQLFNKKHGYMDDKARVRVFNIDEFNYPKFRAKIIDLYLHAFTTGEHAQYIESQSVESMLDELMRQGFGNMAFVDDKLAGVILAMPLSHDADFHKVNHPQIFVEKTLYIAEVMVHTHFRGQGIASRLIDDLLEKASEKYSDAVIRVWEENRPALSLYEKIGFRPFSEISQTKFRSKDETFEMKKVYMLKKIESQ